MTSPAWLDDARAAHTGATLADLYGLDLMPPNLRKAHATLDRAVDRLYRRGGFASERERDEGWARSGRLRSETTLCTSGPCRARVSGSTWPRAGLQRAGGNRHGT